MLTAPSSSYGALSATSANTIQGSRPGFTGQSGAKKLGFKIGNTTYSESEGNLSPSSSGVINYLNAGLRLDEFEVMNLTASDFSPMVDYADADGDVAHPTAAFSMSPRTYVWKDRNGITITNYNQTLGCGSSLNLPLTLRITLPNVKVKSRYGNPSESLSTELVQEYKIGTATGICFAKPNQMIVRPNNSWVNGSSLVWNSGSSTPTPAGGGGYSSDFDPVNGFKASADPKFPTTGFPKASFTLIMTSNASDYTFSSDDSAVIVDTGGKVTLNSKPSGAVTIKAIYKNDTNQVHYYTFNPTTVWVVPKRNPAETYGRYYYDEAKTLCGGELKIPTRADLTNSPQIGHPGGTTVPGNASTRAIDGSVFGEWGWADTTSYQGSQWVSSTSSGSVFLSGYYWTRDVWSSGFRFTVHFSGGHLTYHSVSNIHYVACLG
ncbi:hypothetical protein RCS94_02180 [Orbaceae bacterium ac157xtp]